MVANGILFMNPYDKNGPWLPVTKLDDSAIAMIEQTEREIAELKEAKRNSRREVKSKLGYSRIGLKNV
jgi:hypothetical protein